MTSELPRLRPEVAEVRDLIITMFRALVDHGDGVEVVTLQGQTHVIFEVSVDPRDVAFALGKDGSHANAVRLIARASCQKSKLKFELTVLQERPRKRAH